MAFMTEELQRKMEEIERKMYFRKNICELEEYIKTLPDVLIGDSDKNPLTHTFADGCYIRQIYMPAGQLFTTKIHKKDHPFFLLQGEVSIRDEWGVYRLKAPFHSITKAGTKRILYTHTDTVWVTVHVTPERDLQKIEEEVIAKDFDEMDRVRYSKLLELKGETT